MAKLFEIDRATIGNLFKTSSFQIPDFQRDYDWDGEYIYKIQTKLFSHSASFKFIANSSVLVINFEISLLLISNAFPTYSR